ncbi:MAG: hypothetical protein HYW51_02230 [Candidatus Doudnabacteria bacterium]|nr:hypothetical protein [Candidatus Doudnabacteria bacterium]
MTKEREDAYNPNEPENREQTQMDIDMLRQVSERFATMSNDRLQAIADQLSVDEIDKFSQAVSAVREAKQKSEPERESEKIKEVKISVFSDLNQVNGIGHIVCNEAKGVLTVHKIDIDGEVSKHAMLELADRLGLRGAIEERLGKEGIWGDIFIIAFKHEFTDKANAPRIPAFLNQDFSLADVEFGAGLFGRWAHSGTASFNLIRSTRPTKIEIVI